jgi:3-oxoacyl-[acyl-carrier protein] reductase
MTSEPLAGRSVLVTGVSRRAGIGHAIAKRLIDDGACVFIHGWPRHDEEQPWGADAAGFGGILASLPPEGLLGGIEADLSSPAAPGKVFAAARDRVARIDALVINHARSSKQTLGELTASELDLAWAVNVRAALLLVQAYAQQSELGTNGRVVLFTSGQHLAPMAGELPYAASKGAVHQITLSLAEALADRGVTVNCINPGPTDTGWADDATAEAVRRAMPSGRWNTPGEAAGIVAWLLTEHAATITGQVINAEGGFRRHSMLG